MSQTDRLAGLVGNVAIKAPCDVATTANITLNGEQTIDGIVTSASRVLVKNQTSSINNGIYISDSGAWQRTNDFDGVRDVAQGTLVLVNGGTAGAGFWYVSTTGNPTPGTDAISFGQSSAVLALISAFMQSFLQQTTQAGARTAIGAGDATQAGVQGQTYTNFTTGGTSTAFTLTPTPVTTANTIGQRFRATFHTAAGATPTMAVSGQPEKNLKYKDSTGAKQSITSTQVPSGWVSDVEYDGTDWVVLQILSSLPIVRGALGGLTMSTAGASTTMTIAAGQAADSTNASYITLGSSMGKTTSAWAAGTGNGGLDTGSIANSTWYHFYLIAKADGTTDVTFSTNATTPSLPSGYTLYRRIGSGLTNGSAQWVAFFQDGDQFQWAASVLDVNATNPGTAAVSRTLTVPTGKRVVALVNAATNGGSTNANLYLSDLSVTDEAPSYSAAPLGTVGGNFATASTLTVQARIMTNTSAQIRSRLSASGGGQVALIATLGWIDDRGRNA